jgi:hypothetical protein
LILILLTALPSVQAASTPTPTSLFPALPDQSALTDPSFARPGYENISTPFATKTRYLLALDVDWPNGKISGQARILFVNSTPDMLTNLVLRLYPNHPATPATGTPLAHLRMKVQTLTVDNQPVKWTVSDAYQTKLTIPLTTPLPPGGSAQIDSTYTVAYPPPTDELDGLETFPMLAVYQGGQGGGWRDDISTKGLDYIFSETALYAVTLRAPNNVALYTVGHTVTDPNPDNQHVTYHIVTGPVRDFVYTLTKNWGNIPGKAGDIQIDVRFKGDPVAAQEEADIAAQSTSYYDTHFGPYPYGKLTYLVLSFSSGGIQYPTLLYVDNARDTNYRRFITAHEVAHEWFYGILGNDPLRHAWLGESTAQISLYLFFYDTYGATAAEAEWTHILFWSEQAGGGHAVDTPVMKFYDFSDYMSHTYGTGAIFMRKLLEQIGHDPFLAGIAAYYKTVFLGVGTPQQFLDAMQAQTSIPLAPIFCKGIGFGCQSAAGS